VHAQCVFRHPGTTGKERDTESGNDYFEARYYSSAMGRFLSPDWSAKIEPVPYSKLDDPQSLNLYAYVQNNPLIRIDVDGHDFVILNDSRAVNGEGHNASIVGNDKQGWTYYSKNGYGRGNSRETFKTFSDFQKSKTSERYDRGARVETSSKQDAAMKESGDKNYNKDYSVAATHNKDGSTKAENCADLTATVGQAGGVKIDKPETTTSILGSSFSVDLPATNPNAQFGGVVVNNNSTAVQPHVEPPPQEKKPQ
jgi:RHS repeat-associated protein